MKSPNVKTQRNLSAIIALALAMVTLFQAGTVKSENKEASMSYAEAQLVAEIEEMLEEEALSLEEEIYFEEYEATEEYVKIYNENDELIAEGDPSLNTSLQTLVNQADFLSEAGGKQYLRIAQ